LVSATAFGSSGAGSSSKRAGVTPPDIHFGHHLFMMGFSFMLGGLHLGLYPGLTSNLEFQEFR
jgi:hypothetical protein